MSGKDLIEQGYIQLSRKYRVVARGPIGKTPLEAIYEKDPAYINSLFANALAKIEAECAAIYPHRYADEPPERLTLSKEDFDEFLLAKGKTPISWSKNKCSCGQIWFINGRCPSCGSLALNSYTEGKVKTERELVVTWKYDSKKHVLPSWQKK